MRLHASDLLLIPKFGISSREIRDIRDLSDLDKRIDFGKNVSDQIARCLAMSDEEFRDFAEESLLFHQAVLQEDEQAIKSLAQTRCDINKTTKERITPLHLACRIASVSLVRLLLSFNADASIVDEYGVSPLHWIVLLPDQDTEQIANMLVMNGAEVEQCMHPEAKRYFDTLGLSLFGGPLTWACLCRNITAIRALIALGAMPGFLYDRGEINFALSMMCHDIFDLLFKVTGTVNLTQKEKENLWSHVGVGLTNDLHRWCIHGSSYEKAHAEIIDQITCVGISFPVYPQSTFSTIGSYTPLARAAMSFNTVLVKEYLDRGANVNDRNWTDNSTALDIAILSCSGSTAGDTKILKTFEVLIDHGASLRSQREALGHGNNLNRRKSILHMLNAPDIPPAVIKLLGNRGNKFINEKHCGLTPLHLMVRDSSNDENDVERVRIFLDCGADPDIESDHGIEGGCCYTAVAEALRSGNWEPANLLLERGCSTDIGVFGGHKHTLAHLLVYTGFRIQGKGGDIDNQKVELLFEKLLIHPNARDRNLINGVDCHQRSPIELVIYFGMVGFAKILAEFECEVDLQGASTVVDWLDYCFQYPPVQFVGTKKHAQDRGFPRYSHSEYRENLIAIRKILIPEVEIPSSWIVMLAESKDTEAINLHQPNSIEILAEIEVEEID